MAEADNRVINYTINLTTTPIKIIVVRLYWWHLFINILCWKLKSKKITNYEFHLRKKMNNSGSTGSKQTVPSHLKHNFGDIFIQSALERIM